MVDNFDMSDHEAEKIQSDAPMKFTVWFTHELERNQSLKAHHLSAVRAYFQYLGLSERESQGEYDKGLRQFGF
jgi:hypothetical protein